jgi:hypothetical protein
LSRAERAGILEARSALPRIAPAPAWCALKCPALFDRAGVADKELSALLATGRVIPVAHGTTFEALRDVSPLLAARSGLSTEESSLEDVAAKIVDTVRI